MASSITKTQRWLDLISYLVGRRLPVEVGELMEQLPAYAAMAPESARRVFERDKADLLVIGIPLKFTQYTVDSGRATLEGYSLASHDFFLPYLTVAAEGDAPAETKGSARPGSVVLAPEHLADAVEALGRVADLAESPFATAVRSAYAKIVLDLDTTALEDAPVYIVDAPGVDARSAAESRATLGVLSDALIERRAVTMRYHGIGRGETTERRVDPYALLAAGGRWYLIAHDHTREAIREFRVDRIEGIVAEANTKGRSAPMFSVPADFTMSDYAHRQAWELGGEGEVEARVRFRFPWSLWAERNGHGEHERDEAEGASVRRFRVLSSEPFLRWLLSAEAEMELLSPPALVAELSALATAVTRLYDDEEGGGGDGDA